MCTTGTVNGLNKAFAINLPLFFQIHINAVVTKTENQVFVNKFKALHLYF